MTPVRNDFNLPWGWDDIYRMNFCNGADNVTIMVGAPENGLGWRVAKYDGSKWVSCQHIPADSEDPETEAFRLAAQMVRQSRFMAEFRHLIEAYGDPDDEQIEELRQLAEGLKSAAADGLGLQIDLQTIVVTRSSRTTLQKDAVTKLQNGVLRDYSVFDEYEEDGRVCTIWMSADEADG